MNAQDLARKSATAHEVALLEAAGFVRVGTTDYWHGENMGALLTVSRRSNRAACLLNLPLWHGHESYDYTTRYTKSSNNLADVLEELGY
jgi:hypothetical protein